MPTEYEVHDERLDHPACRKARTGKRQPLAAKLGIAVNIRFGQGDESAVAREMASGSGPALFSWQHEGIPALASHITGENLTATFPSLWPDERFDLVWLFSKSRGAWSFAQFAQKLLAGDSDEPVR
jgi:hypothetical protein